MLLKYLIEYNRETESPKRYHQWGYLATVAAMLGRNAWLPFGHNNIYPNQYIMFIGSPAARKSSAVKAAINMLYAANYTTISKGRTSKEKFLLDLSGHIDDTGIKHNPGLVLTDGNKAAIQNLFDTDLAELGETDEHCETLIAADEFNNYIGTGNYEFISLLGELWDVPPDYPVRVKNSKSYTINKPCVSILAGNTPTGFAAAFPPEILGQGFASRLLLIYGERTNVRTTLPKPPPAEVTAEIAAHLQQIRVQVCGEFTIDLGGEVYQTIDWLYKNWQSLDDNRFTNYSGRRFSHLLKIALLFAANDLRTSIEQQDVVAANTILTLTEHEMPRALGEFGMSKHSEVSNKIVEYLNTVDEPKNITQLWEHFQVDIDKMSAMTEIMTGLVRAKKLQNTKGGFLAVKKALKEDTRFFDPSLIGGI